MKKQNSKRYIYVHGKGNVGNLNVGGLFVVFKFHIMKYCKEKPELK